MVATPGEAAPTRFRSIENAGLVRALAFSPDGKTLAMGLASGLVELADPAGEGRTVTFSAQGGVRSLAFSPDGTRLAAATDASMVLVFEAATQALARELRLAPGPARAARFLPDGRALILASKEGVVRWDLDRHDGVPLPLFGPDPRDVAVTPDGTGLAVADARGILMLGKPAAAAQPPPVKIGVPSQALALAVARSGSIATAEGDRAITLRTAEGKPMARFREPDGAVRDVSFLGTGLVVATFSDGSARIFRAPATTAAAVLRPVPEMRATLVLSGGGLVDLAGEQAGPARAAVRCRLGPALYPFDVCADQFEVPGILQIVLAGQDPAEADP
jgi:WD40 repeat protein